MRHKGQVVNRNMLRDILISPVSPIVLQQVLFFVGDYFLKLIFLCTVSGTLHKFDGSNNSLLKV